MPRLLDLRWDLQSARFRVSGFGFGVSGFGFGVWGLGFIIYKVSGLGLGFRLWRFGLRSALGVLYFCKGCYKDTMQRAQYPFTPHVTVQGTSICLK